MSVIGTDSFLGGGVLKFNTPSPEEVSQDFEIEPNSDEVKSDKSWCEDLCCKQTLNGLQLDFNWIPFRL